MGRPSFNGTEAQGDETDDRPKTFHSERPTSSTGLCEKRRTVPCAMFVPVDATGEPAQWHNAKMKDTFKLLGVFFAAAATQQHHKRVARAGLAHPGRTGSPRKKRFDRSTDDGRSRISSQRR